MPTTSSFLGLQLAVGETTVSYDFATRQNIKKRREDVFYSTISGRENVNLAYALYQRATPDKNTYIADFSRELLENIPARLPDLTISGTVGQTGTDRILVTDIFTTPTNTRPASPLYFAHDLSDLLLTSGVSITDVEVLDAEKEVREDIDLRLELSTGLIYSNHQNSFDDTAGELDLAFLRYTLRDSLAGTAVSRLELLDQEPVFRPATFEDVDEFGRLIETNKAYITEPLFGSLFEVRLPSPTGTYRIRRDPAAQLQLLPPTAQDMTNPWYIRVPSGEFHASVRSGITDGIETFEIHRYRFGVGVRQFDSQPWNPFYPYKLRTENATRVSPHVFKTLRDRIAIDASLGLHLQVIVYDKDENPRRAYSTNPDLVSVEFGDTDIEFTSGIRSIDSWNGFVDVTDPIEEDDRVEATYFFEETQYEITAVDFNPISNTEILNNLWVFYLVPDDSGSRDSVLYFLQVNRQGIVSTSQVDNVDLTAAITAGLSYDVSTADFNRDFSDASLLSFRDRFSTRSRLNPSFPGQAVLLADNPKYFILGEVTTSEVVVPASASILDIRVGGGGILDNPTSLREAVAIQPEVRHSLDLAPIEGLPYPSTAVTFVEVPCGLLITYGGRFEPGEVREVVERHMALGVYPVVKAYANDLLPALDSVSRSSATISWPARGNLVQWNVRLRRSEGGAATLQNSEPILDAGVGRNTYTLTGLTEGQEYWVYVAQRLSSGLEQIGGPIGPREGSAPYIPVPLELGFQLLPASVPDAPLEFLESD